MDNLHLQPLEMDEGKAWIYTPAALADDRLPVLYLQDGDELAKYLPQALDAVPADRQMVIVGVTPNDRDGAYTPWPADAIFKKGEPFTGKMDEFLPRLLALKARVDTEYRVLTAPGSTAVAGLSLSGLLALYALSKSSSFTCAASISGSLWYKDFVPFLKGNPPAAEEPWIYLSLGEREGESRNPVLATVADCHQDLCDFYRNRYGAAHAEYKRFPGGHTTDIGTRLADALAFLAKHLERM